MIMTVKDFLLHVQGIRRIDLIDSEGYVIDMDATAITIIPYLDSKIDTLEFINYCTDNSKDNAIKVVIKLLND